MRGSLVFKCCRLVFILNLTTHVSFISASCCTHIHVHTLMHVCLTGHYISLPTETRHKYLREKLIQTDKCHPYLRGHPRDTCSAAQPSEAELRPTKHIAVTSDQMYRPSRCYIYWADMILPGPSLIDVCVVRIHVHVYKYGTLGDGSLSN